MALSLAGWFTSLGGRRSDVGRLSNPKDIGQLAEPLRSRIYTAKVDCDRHYGREALVLVSGLRSPWQQFRLRVERVGAALSFDRRYPGWPRTAIPYSSDHQDGTAADMGGTGLQWLIDNERAYGLERTVPGERWHFQATRNPIRRIIPFPGTGPVQHDPEEFTMDAEARQALEAIQRDVSLVKGGLMKLQADVDEARDKWWRSAARRTRLLLAHHGIQDDADG